MPVTTRFHFEWQHRGSPHVHGLTWLPDAPDVQQVLSNSDGINSIAAKEVLFQYVDTIISTIKAPYEWSHFFQD